MQHLSAFWTSGRRWMCDTRISFYVINMFLEIRYCFQRRKSVLDMKVFHELQMCLRQIWKEHWLVLEIHRVLLPSHWPAGWWDRLETAAACHLYAETANRFRKLPSDQILRLVNTRSCFSWKYRLLRWTGCSEKQVNAALLCAGLSACYRWALATKSVRVNLCFLSSRQNFR